MDSSFIACFNHLNRLCRSFRRQQAFYDVPCFADIFLAIMKFAPKIAFFCCVFNFCGFVRITFIHKFGNFISFEIMRLVHFLLFLNGDFDAFCNLKLEHKFRLSTAGAGNLFNKKAIFKNLMFTGGRTADKAGSSRPHSPVFSTKNR